MQVGHQEITLFLTDFIAEDTIISDDQFIITNLLITTDMDIFTGMIIVRNIEQTHSAAVRTTITKKVEERQAITGMVELLTATEERQRRLLSLTRPQTVDPQHL